MRVLVACEFSQVVTSAFLKFGCDAYSCDLRKSIGDFPDRHLLCDVREVLYDKWDLVIAHPPCTYLANSGGFRLIGDLERQEKMRLARDFFMMFYNLPGRVCIENPKPSPYCNLPKWSDILQPYEFGDSYSKATYLWLKNLPPLFRSELCFPEYSLVLKKRDPYLRSIFSPGIAHAMALSWSDLD